MSAGAAYAGRVSTVLQRVALALLLLAIWWLGSRAAPVYVLPSHQIASSSSARAMRDRKSVV